MLGGLGARTAARMLRTFVHEEKLEFELPSERIAQIIQDLAETLGRAVPELPAQRDPLVLHFVAGSGALRLNPCLVRISLISVGHNSSVVIRGAAKEGLIRQATAKQAVQRTSAALVAAAAQLCVQADR